MTRHAAPEQPPRVRIPADVDRDDVILGGLTARQLALLAGPAVALWLVYTLTRSLLPWPVFAVVAVPVAIVAVALALGRYDGVGLDRLTLAALRHLRSAKRLVPTGEELPPLPAFLTGLDHSERPAPLVPPVRGVDGGGVLDLGPDGAAVVCRASSVSFTLRTPTEQTAMVTAFGRWLNSLTAGAQLLIRAEPVDLTPTIAGLLAAAGGLPHPALETAALAHASYLADLAERRDLLHRQVLLVLRDPTPSAQAPTGLRRRAEDAATSLAAAGVTLTVLDTAAATRAVTTGLDPAAQVAPDGMSLFDDLVTGTSR